jgi:hypothetical protein
MALGQDLENFGTRPAKFSMYTVHATLKTSFIFEGGQLRQQNREALSKTEPRSHRVDVPFDKVRQIIRAGTVPARELKEVLIRALFVPGAQVGASKWDAVRQDQTLESMTT